MGQAPTDSAKADDQQRLAAQFVLALRQVADHAPPKALRLVVARLGKAPAEGQDQCHGMFRDRLRIHALGTGQADTGDAQRILAILVDTGTDRLDEA